MNTMICVVLLGVVALAVASEPPKDSYSEEKPAGYGHESRGYESEQAAKPRNPYYGGPYYMGEDPYNYPPRRQNREYGGGRYYYGGTYKGQCYNDGLYYMDTYSFVLCSNKNAYVQPCAPGTRNSARNSFRAGYYYGYSDFCDVNLVDYGYGPQHYAPSYTQPGYGRDERRGYGNDKKADNRRGGYGDTKDTSYGYSDESYGSSGYARTVPSYGSDSYNKDDSYNTVESYKPKEDYKPTQPDSYPPQQGYREETYRKEEYGETKPYP